MTTRTGPAALLRAAAELLDMAAEMLAEPYRGSVPLPTEPLLNAWRRTVDMATGRPAAAEPQCGAYTERCIPWGREAACPREPHDHPPCDLPAGHSGRHAWQADDQDQRAPADPAAVMFTMPNPPAAGRHVTDRRDAMWMITGEGRTIGGVGDDTARGIIVELVDVGTDPWDNIGTRVPWSELLEVRGPLRLVPLTPEQQADEELYGPVGARWGDPDMPCPYREGDDGSRLSCELGRNHAGPHKLGPLVLGERHQLDPADEIHYAQRTPCTCGHPAAHDPSCTRFPRITGAPIIDWDELRAAQEDEFTAAERDRLAETPPIDTTPF